jgi:hypothetical protein
MVKVVWWRNRVCRRQVYVKFTKRCAEGGNSKGERREDKGVGLAGLFGSKQEKSVKHSKGEALERAARTGKSLFRPTIGS